MEAMAQRQRVGFQTRRLGVRIPLASFSCMDKGQWSRGMILALGARGRGFDSPLAPFCQASRGVTLTSEALLAQTVERWPFKPMVVGSIPTEGALFRRHSIVVIAPAS